MGMYDGTEAAREDQGPGTPSIPGKAAADSDKVPLKKRLASAAKEGGKSLVASGEAMIGRSQQEAATRASEPSMMPSLRKGGKVKKTGPHRLHKGEVVLSRSQVKKAKRALKSRRGE
jgi:hypothetical protein